MTTKLKQGGPLVLKGIIKYDKLGLIKSYITKG